MAGVVAANDRCPDPTWRISFNPGEREFAWVEITQYNNRFNSISALLGRLFFDAFWRGPDGCAQTI